MSPLKTELSLRLSLGQKRFKIGDLSIDLFYGTTLGKIPEEIRADVENIMKRARKERTIGVESQRKTRQRLNEQRKRNRRSRVNLKR
jgi:hypothetical protein